MKTLLTIALVILLVVSWLILIFEKPHKVDKNDPNF